LTSNGHRGTTLQFIEHRMFWCLCHSILDRHANRPVSCTVLNLKGYPHRPGPVSSAFLHLSRSDRLAIQISRKAPDVPVTEPMIDTQIIDTHLARAALHHPMSKPNAHNTVNPTVDGDKAYTGTQRRPRSQSHPSTDTTPRVGSVDLSKYLAYLKTQREQMEMYAKHK
jgi:hypothetical protein